MSAVLNQHSTVIVVRNSVEYVHVGISRFTAAAAPSSVNTYSADIFVIADERFDPVVVAFVVVMFKTVAFVKSVFVKFAFVKLHPVRSAPLKFTPDKSTPVKSVCVILSKWVKAFSAVPVLVVRRE